MPVSPNFRSRLLPTIDYILVVFAGLLTYFIRFKNFDISDRYLLTILLSGFIAVTIMNASRAYLAADTNAITHFRRLIVPWLIIALAITLLGYISKSSEYYSRIWAGLWFLTGLIMVLGARVLVGQLGHSRRIQRWFARQLVLVGKREDLAQLEQVVREKMSPWFHISGLFLITGTGPGTDQSVDVQVVTKDQEDTANDLPSIDTLLDWSRERRIDDIILVPSKDWNEIQVTEILHPLQQIPANLHLGPLNLLRNFPGAQRMDLGPLSLLNMTRQPLDASQRLFKSLQDWMLAFAGLLLVTPLMLLISLAIKVYSPGPVLFRQRRYGFRREVITVFKFRTMINDPNTDLSVRQASRDDPRVTPLGRLLRRFSLDELPQLFNVLNGSMALTGPRPHALPHDDHYGEHIDLYLSRHKVKPGITGWAQANGYRGEIVGTEDMQQRLEHDLYYVENWSPVLDMEIILRTVFIVVSGRNAY